MLFEWDISKAVSNQKKHGISFDMAKMVFEDPFAISIPDKFHSDDEDRWVTIGQAENAHLVVVIHAYRGNEDQEIIRLISARKATPKERRQYLELPGGR